jgi:hypothetical protein
MFQMSPFANLIYESELLRPLSFDHFINMQIVIESILLSTFIYYLYKSNVKAYLFNNICFGSFLTIIIYKLQLYFFGVMDGGTLHKIPSITYNSIINQNIIRIFTYISFPLLLLSLLRVSKVIINYLLKIKV